MGDNEKRIVVEGVEFAQLVQFPRILRAVTGAFQPPRLMLGLLMVAALMTGGRLWDGLTSTTVPPAGLLAEPWTPVEADRAREAAQDVWAAVLDDFQVGSDERGEGELEANEVKSLIRVKYGPDREELANQAGESDETFQQFKDADDRFLAAMQRIDSVRPRGIFEATVSHATGSFNKMIKGLVSLEFAGFYEGLGELCVGTPVGMWRHSMLFTIVYGAFFILLMSVGGGALSRMTAVETALGEKLRVQEAVDFALGSWRRLVSCLVLPLLIAAVLCVLLLVGGFFLMLPWMDVVGGLLYGVALLLGFGVVFLLIGYALGFSLLVPAVSSENCDAADAQQRAYAYVLSRPLHLLGYGFVGFVGMALGFVIASLFAVAILNVTGALVDAATINAAVKVSYGFDLFDLGPRSTSALPLQLHSELSASLVMLWQTVVVCIVAGYVFAYYFGASTIIYLLMRRVCDGQEIDEIWQPGVVPGTMAEEPQPESEPAADASSEEVVEER